MASDLVVDSAVVNRVARRRASDKTVSLPLLCRRASPRSSAALRSPPIPRCFVSARSYGLGVAGDGQAVRQRRAIEIVRLHTAALRSCGVIRQGGSPVRASGRRSASSDRTRAVEHARAAHRRSGQVEARRRQKSRDGRVARSAGIRPPRMRALGAGGWASRNCMSEDRDRLVRASPDRCKEGPSTRRPSRACRAGPHPIAMGRGLMGRRWPSVTSPGNPCISHVGCRPRVP